MTATDALRPAVALLAEIVSAFPDLPAPAVVLHQEPELGITVQSQRACDMEAWREALGIDPGWVVLHTYANAVWADATARIGGVRVQLHSDVPLVPDRAKVSPQDDAERRYRVAQLVEQRHQLDAEPGPAAYVAAPAPAPAPLPLADSIGGAM